MKLLVVEDDEALAGLLQKGLTAQGHAVDIVHDGSAGLEQARAATYDALVLDVMLPGLDGVEVAQRLRRAGVRTPILMLTARDALDDRLRGFDAGVDDYVPKPFAFAELLARLRAIVRRAGASDDEELLVVGDLALNRRSWEVTRAGRPITLSPKEFALLEYLMRHPGRALSRTLMLEHVWGRDVLNASDSLANVVDATIRRLRREVDEGFDRPLIQTVRGVGYKIKAP